MRGWEGGDLMGNIYQKITICEHNVFLHNFHRKIPTALFLGIVFLKIFCQRCVSGKSAK